MRILCIVDCYLPSTRSSARLMSDLAAEFGRCGHEVALAVPDDEIQQPLQVRQEDGIEVARIRTGKIKGASRIVRAINEVRLSTVLWRRGRWHFLARPFDLIVFYSPSIFFGRLVDRLKRAHRCGAYLILRDIFPQWAVDAGVLRPGLVQRYFAYRERQQYAAADIIGVQSPANLRYFEENPPPPPARVEVLYNWAAIDPPPPDRQFRRQLGLQDKVVFFYGGNLGVAQDMDNILRLARGLAADARCHFLLVGDGSEAQRLSARIAQDRLTNVTIHPPLPQEQYARVVGQFDIGLISLDRRLKTQNLPGKMLSYMAQSMPILASVNPGNDLLDMIQRHQAGLACLNGNDEEFLRLARQLAGDADLRRRLGLNARKMMDEYFTVQRAAGQILAHFVK